MVLPRLPRSPNGLASCPDASAVDAARDALRRDGFAVVPGLFDRESLAEVERLLDAALAAAACTPSAHRFLVRYPARQGGTTGNAPGVDKLGGWDQLELNYATALSPALRETAVFRGITALARALAGPVSRSFDHVIYKGAGNETATPWHQDAAFTLWGGVPPRQLHFWLPLQDVTAESGCMTFIAGSHRAPLLRHRRMLRTSGQPGREVLLDASLATPCPLAAGGLTIHMPTTLHCAGRNASTVPRKAWILQFGPLAGMRLALKRVAGALPRPVAALR